MCLSLGSILSLGSSLFPLFVLLFLLPQTCAHRYQQRLFVGSRQEARDITGRCYVLSQDLTIDPDRDGEGGEWKFCSGRQRGHERFGSCQQGLSATFTKDYHYLIFGAPGAYNWKGKERTGVDDVTLRSTITNTFCFF